MERLIDDLRFSWRQALKAPGLTMAILVCLALGIGANSATFSVAESLLVPASAVKQPERLVRLYLESTSGLKFGSFSYPDWKDLQDQCRAFAELASDTPVPLSVSLDGQNERFWGSLVSANYFPTLGVELAMGHGFRSPEDMPPNVHSVAVLSQGFWERRFGSDPRALGRTIYLNGQPFTIIGVAPKGFYGANNGFRSELWVPMASYSAIVPGPGIKPRDHYWMGSVIGRLAPGATVDQAKAQVAAVMSHLREIYPATNTGKSAAVYEEAGASLHPMVRGAAVGFLGLMFAVVGFVLLLACSNVAGLLMARSAARRREIAIRLALGVGRRRLLRQLMTESTALAVGAGILGLLLSLVLTRAIQLFRPPLDLPIAIQPQLDPRVLGFTLFIAVLTGILFGLAPALQATRTDLVSSLKQDSPGGGSGRVRWRKALVIGQVCLSMILLIGASLTLQSFANARQANVGFRPDHVLIAAVDPQLQGYGEARGLQFMRTLRQSLAGLPGVAEVSFASSLPLSLSRPETFVLPEGFDVPKGADKPIVGYSMVGPDYFKAMGIPLLQGRAITAADGAGGSPVALVNETFAKRFWPHESPIGRHINGFHENLQVVGLVRDGKYFSLGEDPTPYMYVPLERHYGGPVTFVVHSLASPSSLLERVRQDVGALDPRLPVFNLRTMSEQVSFALLPARLAAGIITTFAVLALFLSAVGLYALVSYWVNQRARDIAIRRAIGASVSNILALVVRQGLSLAVAGLLVGLVIGVALARMAAGLLYGVSFGNPVPYLAAAGALLVVVLLATLLPARKAVVADIVQSLRGE
jgi:macrolide transport system ATP-binding/permease protein